MKKRLVGNYLIIIISLIVAGVFLFIEIKKMLFLSKGVENSLPEEIIIATSYFFAQAVFIALIINATICNLNYLLKEKNKTGTKIFLMITSWVLELLAIFFFVAANSTPIMYLQPLLIISLILLCLGIINYKTSSDYLYRAMLYWGIAILLFLSIADVLYNLFFVPFGPEWIYF